MTDQQRRSIGKLVRRSTMFFVALWGAACSSMPTDTHLPDEMRIAAAAAAKDIPFVLRAGDTIAAQFYQSPELDVEVLIRPDGMIALPLVGDVAAGGRTPNELSKEVAALYAGELAIPRVVISVRKLGSYHTVTVAGEVKSQGAVSLNENLTVYEAIQLAGGFLTTAHRRKVVLVRGMYDGNPKGYSIDLRPIQDGERPGEDVRLEPRDIVFVPRSKVAEIALFVEQYFRALLPVNPTSLLLF